MTDKYTVPSLVVCADDHLHCMECSIRIPFDGPVLLMPYDHADTGERAMGGVCSSCAAMLLVEDLDRAMKRRQRRRDERN